jgi:hypothetical protein
MRRPCCAPSLRPAGSGSCAAGLLGTGAAAAAMMSDLCRRCTATAVVIVVMSVSVGARASEGFMDGYDLYGFCTSSGSLCGGYIEAIANAYNPINAYIACEPPRISTGQAVDVVKQYLATHPEQRYKPAWSLVMVALAEAFPCRR